MRFLKHVGFVIKSPWLQTILTLGFCIYKSADISHGHTELCLYGRETMLATPG